MNDLTEIAGNNGTYSILYTSSLCQNVDDVIKVCIPSLTSSSYILVYIDGKT